MRRGIIGAVLAVLALAGCSQSKPFRDMVGYVPPTSLPAQPKRTMVQDRPAQVWNNILDYLDQSDFAIDHTDSESRLIVARYSGNPEPYIDCGSIVTHENGALGQIAGAAGDVTLNYRLDKRPVLLKRGLNLDSRVIIRLQEQRLGTVVSTDTTYVVTKTVDVEKSSGSTTEGSRETVSFSAGKRAEFSKGTACQPNGSLDQAILQSLPNVIGSNEITRADLPVDPTDRTAITDGIVPPRHELPILDPPEKAEIERQRDVDQARIGKTGIDDVDAAIVPEGSLDPVLQADEPDWTFSEPDQPADDDPASDPSARGAGQQQGATRGWSVEPGTPLPTEQRPATPSTTVPSPDRTVDRTVKTGVGVDDVDAIVDETTRTLRAAFDCQGIDWHYCEAVSLTAPYRKINIEQAIGLTVSTADKAVSQAIGSDLRLDVNLPDFPSFLHVVYLERDGTVDTVISSAEQWPADLSHRLQDTGRAVPGPAGLAMIIAVVSEQPLFPEGQLDKDEARAYLDRLERRLAEINTQPGNSRIAASQLLINVE